MGIAQDFAEDLVGFSQKFTDILTKSTCDLFSTMFQQKIEHKSTAFQELVLDQHEISGVVNIFEKDFEGTFIVSFSKESILQMMSSFYGKDIEMIDEIVLQGVNEITNIIFGNFKKELYELGYSFKMLLPSTVYGNNHKYNICNKYSKILKLTFEIEQGQFFDIFLVMAE